MKLGKKSLTILSFTVGACMFVSTAFADMALGTGYDRLKGSIKNTAEQMENGLDNYTIEMLITVKDNDQTLVQNSTFKKFDIQKQMSEESTVTQDLNDETTSQYSYSDREISVWKNNGEDKYYMTELTDEYDRGDRNVFSNPFNEDGALEVEKVFDALVGNLKDHVQTEDRPEGGRIYTGSLSEAQVPALINAISSFGVKRSINDERRIEEDSKLPEIESDIYVKKVSGTAVENKEGLLENLTANVVLSGKEKNGVQHELSLNVDFKLTDIGSTVITKPDLASKNVEKVGRHYSGFNSKYVGKYKNNIIMEIDEELVKVGERVLEITSVEDNKVTGKYYEIVKPEFEAKFPDTYNFTFEYDYSKSRSFFTYKNSKGEEEHGELYPSFPGKVHLDLNLEIIGEDSYGSNLDHDYFDREFNLVFEE